MDYEKKYKEALERAKQVYKTPYTAHWDVMKGLIEHLFPELKETDDERMRKEIGELVMQQTWKTEAEFHRRKELIDWLEKQGEQKPVDKVEPKYAPKFHKGDWVACNSDDLRYLLRIVSISDKEYKTEDIQGVSARPKIWYLDKHYHLWTIQDAKDGDVLAEDSCIFIIKKLKQDEIAEIYCCLFDDGDFELNSSLMFAATSTYPATKEQRDFLFQKMHEAGYEWDAERKEVYPLSKSEETNNQEQKPAWSAKDEMIRMSIISDMEKMLRDAKVEQYADIISAKIKWLESLKDRIK